MERRLGFIRDKLDIKILILFILRRLPEPVTLDMLADLTLCDDGISYFDFTECIAELMSTEHVSSDGNKYLITEKGGRNGAITESSLPYSVRMKAEKSTAAFKTKLNRDSMIYTTRNIRRGGGYTVQLSLSDGIGEVISMELLAGSEKQATAIENGFRNKAELIYNELIKLILDK